MLQRDTREVTRTPTWHSCPRQPQDTEAQGTTEATAAQSPALFPGGLGAQACGDALARPSPPHSPPGEQIPSSQREGRGSEGTGALPGLSSHLQRAGPAAEAARAGSVAKGPAEGAALGPTPWPSNPSPDQSTLYCHRTATLALTSHVKDHTWLGGGKATAHPSDRAQTVLSLEPPLPALTGRLWGGPSCTQNTYVLKIPHGRDL